MGATKKLMMKLSAKQTTPGLAYRYTVVVTKIAQARQHHQYMMALYLKIGADNRNRTCTSFHSQPPQGCAATNYAISAYGGDDRSRTCTPFGNKVWAYRVLPFRHVPINFGAAWEIRTLRFQGLSLLPLPIWLTQHNLVPQTRFELAKENALKAFACSVWLFHCGINLVLARRFELPLNRVSVWPLYQLGYASINLVRVTGLQPACCFQRLFLRQECLAIPPHPHYQTTSRFLFLQLSVKAWQLGHNNCKLSYPLFVLSPFTKFGTGGGSRTHKIDSF